jgi:3-carboxy-cis,cis-muconate cycloisomerase
LTLFAAIFVPDELRSATSDRSWLEAMVAVERALAEAEVEAGVVPADAGAAIVAACERASFDPEAIAADGRAVGNPAEPLVRALRKEVGGDAAQWVHRGATSQDVVDTALMLVAREATALVLAELDRLAAACARRARDERGTVMAARTLLQQAVPTTFGLKAAGWLVGVVEARAALRRWRAERLAAQLGGAAGTLAALGDDGARVAELFAEKLGLPQPPLPWHTNRTRVAELGAALALAAGAAAKVGVDVALLAQSEIGEVAPPAGGGSSTMPQKRNPTQSALAVAAARQVTADASVLAGSLVQEHERALGSWHAEWGALSRALALAGGAAAHVADLVEGLEVDAARMRANLDEATLSERAVMEFGVDKGALAQTPLRELVPPEGLDPAGYLGSAQLFVDRALALYEEGA